MTMGVNPVSSFYLDFKCVTNQHLSYYGNELRPCEMLTLSFTNLKTKTL